MIDYHQLKDDESLVYKKRGTMRRKTKNYSDTIYSFDIETSNLFFINGEWRVFDYNKTNDFYKDIEKISIPYIWQFGINDTVYYGREFRDFLDVLKMISNKDITKIVWIHNASFEFQFLLNIFEDYTIENMVSRDLRKPISWTIKELNIEFRCSYMLTNLSLKKASEEFTNIEKLDTLNYDSCVRTPLTKLSTKELLYCEYDIKCVYEIIKYFRERYEHLCLIPLTSTGEVRREFKKQVDYYYIKKQQKLVPSRKTYLILWACFAGGYTHANILNVNQVIKQKVYSMDICSSYPYSLCCKLPSTQFMKCFTREFMTNDNFGYIAYIKFYGVKSKYYNHYMQISKCINSKDLIGDNGRVVKCSYTEMWLTSVDMEIILKNYNIHHYEVIECYKSYLDYLDERILKFIIRLYGNKTKLKGIKEKEAIYKRDKSMLNSLYGMSVTNPLKQSSTYDNGWTRESLTKEFVDKKLNEMRRSNSTLLYYGVGLWVCAISRKHLMDCVLYSHEFDKHVIYCDTDSIKYYGDYDYIFEEYNKGVYNHYIELCERFPDFKIQDFMPVDINGHSHPLGFYESDSKNGYTEFKTLGAKKYCYREDGELHLTLAGVSKKGVTALNDNIKNFKKGFVFDFRQSGKLTHYYNDNQPETDIIDIDGNIYHSMYKYGIVLAPTTYTLGMTDLYDILVNDYFIKEAERRKKNGNVKGNF